MYLGVVMRSFLTSIVAVMLAVFTVSASAGECKAGKGSSYNFVLSASTAKVVKLSDTVYKLKLNVPDINQVLVYEDRSTRGWKYISTEDLAKLWKSGNNSFAKNPPNAILSSSDIRPIPVLIKGININSKTSVEFNIESMNMITADQLQKVVLDIDALECCVNASCCLFCGWTQKDPGASCS